MRFVILVVLALLTSLDSFGVGVALGLGGTRIRPFAHGIISTVMLAITGASVALGNRLANILPEHIAHYVDALFFVGVGVGMLMPLANALRKGQSVDCVDSSGDSALVRSASSACQVGPLQALGLGFMLSINNVGGGVSAGLIDMDPLMMAVASVFFNVVLIVTGHAMGTCVRKTPIRNWVQVMAAVTMVAIGLYQLFQGSPAAGLGSMHSVFG